jgi:cell division transport system permease protein
MAIKVDYVARETWTNLKRNFTLTAASMMTVAVSLALVGSAFIVRSAVDHATARWKGGVDFIVFMKPDASQAQVDAVGRQLRENPTVEKIRFVDQTGALSEFKDMFRNQPALVDAVKADQLPSSWRVTPKKNVDATTIDQVANSFRDGPGVFEVVFNYDAVRTLQHGTNFIGNVILGTAIALLVAASLLILNTIRTAMFARRREIEVMKLVGATNWFIRVPFMVEGVIQGLVGAVPAVAAVWAMQIFLDRQSSHTQPTATNLFAGLYVSGGETALVSILLVVVGCGIGLVGSALAVTRYLDI